MLLIIVNVDKRRIWETLFLSLSSFEMAIDTSIPIGDGEMVAHIYKLCSVCCR